jgi:ribosomal protein L37E
MSHGAEYTWIPGVRIDDDIPVCERCGHHAGSHRKVANCRCSGYVRSDSKQPLTSGLLRAPGAR